MFVRTGANGSNPMLFWIESGNLLSASLSPQASTSPSPSGKSSSSVKPSPSK
jgi:hypothetical protein